MTIMYVQRCMKCSDMYELGACWESGVQQAENGPLTASCDLNHIRFSAV